MTVMDLSKDELKELSKARKQYPALGKHQELTVQYAEEQGGLTLAFWRLFQGDLFGEPVMMTTDECAKRLNVPVSTLETIYQETRRWVDPRWKASPEYQNNPSQGRKKEGE
jgi:hypothetical protein